MEDLHGQSTGPLPANSVKAANPMACDVFLCLRTRQWQHHLELHPRSHCDMLEPAAQDEKKKIGGNVAYGCRQALPRIELAPCCCRTKLLLSDVAPAHQAWLLSLVRGFQAMLLLCFYRSSIMRANHPQKGVS